MNDTLTISGGIMYSPETELIVYFDIVTEHAVQISNNITDNWLENNTVVNDSMGRMPAVVTLNGASGELVYSPADYQDFLQDFLNTENADLMREYEKASGLNDKLGALVSLYPPVDNITQTAINIKDAVMGNIDRFKGIFSRLKGNNRHTAAGQYQGETPAARQTRLEQIYAGIEKANIQSQISGIGFTVITPFKLFENMFIQNANLTQGNILHAADIQITLKQINFSAVTSQQADKKVYAEFNANARAAVENQGKVSGHNVSLLKGVYSGGN